MKKKPVTPPATEHNQAFIDGQNLYLGTTQAARPWKVDLKKFRFYLQRKYNVDQAFYFIGCFNADCQDLYGMLQSFGYILVFREHTGDAVSHKKGNVDTDIVFSLMRTFHEHPEVTKLYLISGDGDYCRVVKYLRDQGRLGKVLLPNRENASGLYNTIGDEYRTFLDTPEVKKKISRESAKSRGGQHLSSKKRESLR